MEWFAGGCKEEGSKCPRGRWRKRCQRSNHVCMIFQLSTMWLQKFLGCLVKERWGRLIWTVGMRCRSSHSIETCRRNILIVFSSSWRRTMPSTKGKDDSCCLLHWPSVMAPSRTTFRQMRRLGRRSRQWGLQYGNIRQSKGEYLFHGVHWYFYNLAVDYFWGEAHSYALSVKFQCGSVKHIVMFQKSLHIMFSFLVVLITSFTSRNHTFVKENYKAQGECRTLQHRGTLKISPLIQFLCTVQSCGSPQPTNRYLTQWM